MDAAAPHEGYPATATEGLPFLSIGWIVLLAAILWIEFGCALGHDDTIGAGVLWALGGSSRIAVIGDGQWWRLVTASLLHVGLIHFALNAFALGFAGRLLERLIGWRWFAACFALSAVAGSLTSTLWNVPNMVGVGASGGILGLFAAMGVLAFRFPPDGHHERLLIGAAWFLLPSIAPFAVLKLLAGGSMGVDVAARIGGAIAGALIGLALLRVWPANQATPPYGRVALAIAAAYAAVAVASLAPITAGFATTRVALIALAPNYPADQRAAADLLAKYPRDPRVRYAHACALIKRNDLVGARRDLDVALGDAPMLRPEISGAEPYLRGTLAVVEATGGQKPEAQATLAGRCPELKPLFPAAFARLGLCR